MTYRVQIAETPDAPLPPEGWRTIEARDREMAVIELLRRRPNLSAGALWGYVALDAGHPNGAPIAVQGFKLQLSERSDT